MDTADTDKRRISRIYLASEVLDIRILAHADTSGPMLDRLTKARERVREILLEETLKARRSTRVRLP